MKRKRSSMGIALDKLLDTPAMKAALASAQEYGYTEQVQCPICRNQRLFATKNHAELHKADLRRALVGFVGRAIHKFLD